MTALQPTPDASRSGRRSPKRHDKGSLVEMTVRVHVPAPVRRAAKTMLSFCGGLYLIEHADVVMQVLARLLQQ